jgi:DNA modification methylase
VSVFHHDPWLTIHGGDCRDVLATMPDESVHAVVTSPPYWNLRDYGIAGQLGLEPRPEDYITAMVGVFREVWRVLRRDGTLWLNMGDSFAGRGRPERGHSRRTDLAPIPRKANANGGSWGLKSKDLVGMPWRLALALQADGWYLRRDVIWSKPNPMPESADDRPATSHEYLFMLTRSERYLYDAWAVREDAVGAAKRNRRSVWTIPTQQYLGAHFATFPEALVEPCILASTSERGTCSICGAPWRRVVRTSTPGRSWNGNTGGLQTGAAGARGSGRQRKEGWVPDHPVEETWRIACEHDAPPVPAVVLDPFGGTGTVGQVANRRGRRAVLVDLNPEYLQQQLRRANALPMGL